MKPQHPDSAIFPAMTEAEFNELVTDIAENGLLEPITVLDGKILDGRHRDRACSIAGVAPTYADWDADCGITPLEWVISKNLHRRQLTTSQRAAIAVELEGPLSEASRRRESERKRTQSGGVARNRASAPTGRDRRVKSSAYIAGKVLGVSSSSVSALKAVKNRDPQMFERVKNGEITKETARRAIGLPPSGGHARNTKTKSKLQDVLAPVRSYLKNWHPDRLYGVGPKEAKKLLKQIQEVDAGLFEVERALEERSVTSRALR